MAGLTVLYGGIPRVVQGCIYTGWYRRCIYTGWYIERSTYPGIQGGYTPMVYQAIHTRVYTRLYTPRVYRLYTT